MTTAPTLTRSSRTGGHGSPLKPEGTSQQLGVPRSRPLEIDDEPCLVERLRHNHSGEPLYILTLHAAGDAIDVYIHYMVKMSRC